MEKYLGNKSSLLPLIEEFIAQRAPNAFRISDLFAGTTNVSRYFRARGWETLTCDVNRFSYVLAQTYLRTTSPYEYSGLPASTKVAGRRMESIWDEFRRSSSRYGHLYLSPATISQYEEYFSTLAAVLAHLQDVGEGNKKPGVITNHFTQWGKDASYLSVRGTEGVRNYFSRENALFLDGVLAKVRQWWQEERVSLSEIFAILTSIIEEVVITANVSGTFHDFNRDRIWPNAQQAFKLRMPLIPVAAHGAEIANLDAVEAAGAFPYHDVCYLDPPYNFRQYSAYYHLLNFIPAIPFLRDLKGYVNGLQHVRGQNPDDNFTSDFCFRDKFVLALRQLVQSVDADHIVLSYYSGRNHWNHWAAVDEPTDEGRIAIEELFADTELFETYEVVPALDVRKNYQSRSGEQKGLVNELLFYGKRTGDRKKKNNNIVADLMGLPANKRWGLCEQFGHVKFTPIQKRDSVQRAPA
jgi:adenine-specific DNA methylase